LKKSKPLLLQYSLETGSHDTFTTLSLAPRLDYLPPKEDILEIESKYFPNCWWNIFRKFVMYLDGLDDFLHLEPLIVFYGGNVSKVIDETVTHIIVDQKDLSRLMELTQQAERIENGIRIVSLKWIFECIQQKEDLDEFNFEPLLEQEGKK